MTETVSVANRWTHNGNTVAPLLQQVTVNNESLANVNKFATDCFILHVDNGILKTRQSEPIKDGKLGSTADITLRAADDWYALLFYYVRKGDVIYTNIFLKKKIDEKIVDLTTDGKYENIYAYLNEKLEGTTRENTEATNSSEIAKIKPLTYPKNDYSKELVRIENILVQMYDTLLEEVKTMNDKQADKVTIQGMTEMRQQYTKVEDLCSQFLDIMGELKQKNQQNIEQLKRKKEELSQPNNENPDPIQLKSLNTKFVFNDSTLGSSFYYPPFDLTTNEKFQKLINKYEAHVTDIANKLKDVESTKDFIDESKGNTALMLSKIGTLRSKYAIVIMTLEKLSDKTDNEIKTGIEVFNRDAEKIRKNLEHLISEYGKNISGYTDSNSTIRNALNDFYDYITSTTRMLHDKFKNNISELKLQNRQSDYLSLKPLENISIKPNRTVELTNPHHMNYNSALNTSYSVHYMNEFIKTSVSYESSALPDPANVYKLQKYEVMYPGLSRMRNATDNLKYNRDFQDDIGYDNFLYLVEEFMHVFSKIRYHPLLYKLNGLKQQDFNDVFTNTSDFRYISEFDNDSSNKDYDDETELHDKAEADYIKYSTRNKMDFESAVPKTYTSDVEFLRHLTLEMERKKKDSFTRMVEELIVDFRKLESENKRLVEVEGEVNNFALSKLDMRNATLEAQAQYSKQRSANLEIHKNNLVLQYRDYLLELKGKLAIYETKIEELDAAGDTEIKANLQIAVNRLAAKIEDVKQREASATKNSIKEENIVREEKILHEMKDNPAMTKEEVKEYENNMKADDKHSKYETKPEDFKEGADIERKSGQYADEKYEDFIERIMKIDETENNNIKISNQDGNLYKEKFRSFIPSNLDNRNKLFADIGDRASQFTFMNLGTNGKIEALQDKIVDHYIDDPVIGEILLKVAGEEMSGGMTDDLKKKVREGLQGRLRKCLKEKANAELKNTELTGNVATLTANVQEASQEKEALSQTHEEEKAALTAAHTAEKKSTDDEISELGNKIKEADEKSKREGKAADLKTEISRELTAVFNTASAVADAKRSAAEEREQALEEAKKTSDATNTAKDEEIEKEKEKVSELERKMSGLIAKSEREGKAADLRTEIGRALTVVFDTSDAVSKAVTDAEKKKDALLKEADKAHLKEKLLMAKDNTSGQEKLYSKIYTLTGKLRTIGENRKDLAEKHTALLKTHRGEAYLKNTKEQRDEAIKSHAYKSYDDFPDSEELTKTAKERNAAIKAAAVAAEEAAKASSGGQRGGNIKEYSNYNLKKLKQMYLDTIYPKSDLYCNFVNDLFTTRTNEYSERFVLLLRHLTSETELLKNGKIYFDRYYNFDPTNKPKPTTDYKPKRRINLFHFVSIIYSNYSDYFKRARGIYVKTRFFSSIIRTVTQKFQVFQKLIHLFESQEPKFLRRISNLISDNNKDNILSYIKFRSDDPNHYNARFDIYFNRITENTLTDRNNLNGGLRPIQFIYPNENYYDTLFIRYNDDDLKYYTSIKHNDNKSSADHINSGKTKKITYDIASDITGDILTTEKGDGSGRMIYSLKDEIIYALKKKLNCFPNQMYYENKRNGNLVFPKYDHNYIFGRFTKVFQPKLSNSEIASSMDHVIEQLLMHNPVFIMGYGASGAGKTSTLIYYNKGDPGKKNGIVMDLANILAGKGYTQIVLKAEEVYETQQYSKEGEVKADRNEPIKICSADTTFEYAADQGGFVLSGESEYKHQNVHLYRNVSAEAKTDRNKDANLLGQITQILEDKLNNKKSEKVFAKNAALGDIIIHLVDTDRLVKATTNNVNSSRSHTLVYLTFIKAVPAAPDGFKYDPNLSIGENIKNSVQTEEDRLELIIGDFAGVENSFNCELPAVVSQFQNIKKDGDENGTLFYADASTPIDKAYDNGEGGAEENCTKNSQGGGVGRTVSLTADKLHAVEKFEEKDIERYIKTLGKSIKLDDKHFKFENLLMEYYNNPKYDDTIKKKYFGEFDIGKINEYVTSGKDSIPKKQIFENLTNYVDINTWDDIDKDTYEWQAHLSTMLARTDNNHTLAIPDSMLENITVLQTDEDNPIRTENFLPKISGRFKYLETAGASEIAVFESKITEHQNTIKRLTESYKTQTADLNSNLQSLGVLDADLQRINGEIHEYTEEILKNEAAVGLSGVEIQTRDQSNAEIEKSVDTLNRNKQEGIDSLRILGELEGMPKFNSKKTNEIIEELTQMAERNKKTSGSLAEEKEKIQSNIKELPQRIGTEKTTIKTQVFTQGKADGTKAEEVDYAFPIRGLISSYGMKSDTTDLREKDQTQEEKIKLSKKGSTGIKIRVYRTYISGFKMLTSDIGKLTDQYKTHLDARRKEIVENKYNVEINTPMSEHDQYILIVREGAGKLSLTYSINDNDFFTKVLKDIKVKVNSNTNDLRVFDDNYTPLHFYFYLAVISIILEGMSDTSLTVSNTYNNIELKKKKDGTRIYVSQEWYLKTPFTILKDAVLYWFRTVKPHIAEMTKPENIKKLSKNRQLIRDLTQTQIIIDPADFDEALLRSAVQAEIELKRTEMSGVDGQIIQIKLESEKITDVFIPAVKIMQENQINEITSKAFSDILSEHYSSIILKKNLEKTDTSVTKQKNTELSSINKTKEKELEKKKKKKK